MVCAAVVEDTLTHTLEILRGQRRPCGVLLSGSLDRKDVKNYKLAAHTLHIENSCVFLNFAGDAHTHTHLGQTCQNA